MVSKTLVLVFDDFERSKQDKTILLGTINNYCENKKIKKENSKSLTIIFLTNLLWQGGLQVDSAMVLGTHQ